MLLLFRPFLSPLFPTAALLPPPLLIIESMAASASSGLERLTALILAISSVTLVGLIFSTVGGAPATCSTIGGIVGDAYLGEEGPC